MQLQKDIPIKTLFFSLLAIVFLFVLIRSSWLTDDAYISFRVIDNFVHGYGLRWNIDERVQAFTNPLWVFFLSPIYAITHDFFFTAQITSIALSVTIFILVGVWFCENTFALFFYAATLIFSKAFIDHSSSGLENPLTHLLIILFLYIFIKKNITDDKNFFLLYFLSSLLALNRQDALLIVFPALIYIFLQNRSWRKILIAGIAFLPFILWEIFCFFYYGFFFPNTAYAKLNTGIPSLHLAFQGALYLLQSVTVDPLTLFSIISALIISALARKKKLLVLSLGILLQLIYIVRVGGDFMAGRFLTLPFIVSTVVLTLSIPYPNLNFPLNILPSLIAITLGFMGLYPTVLSNENYGKNNIPECIDKRGIADERSCYFQGSGLIFTKRNQPMPNHPYAEDGKRTSREPAKVVGGGAIGYFGFYAGPQKHIIDGYALADPLLARIPMYSKKNYFNNWRIGHFGRRAPAGYFQTVESGTNSFLEKNIGQYYEKLSLIIRNPVFSKERIKEIIKMNKGDYNYLIDNYLYNPEEKIVSLNFNQVNRTIPEGTRWDDPQVFQFSSPGISITFDEKKISTSLEVSLDHHDSYHMTYFLQNTSVGETDIPPNPLIQGGLSWRTIPTPENVKLTGFDRILITPVEWDGAVSLGHVKLISILSFWQIPQKLPSNSSTVLTHLP